MYDTATGEHISKTPLNVFTDQLLFSDDGKLIAALSLSYMVCWMNKRDTEWHCHYDLRRYNTFIIMLDKIYFIDTNLYVGESDWCDCWSGVRKLYVDVKSVPQVLFFT